MNVAFFVRHFTERGTEVAVYDYANHNELILKNKSYIICFTESAQRKIGFPPMRHSYEKFKARFPIIEISKMEDMAHVISDLSLNFFIRRHMVEKIYINLIIKLFGIIVKLLNTAYLIHYIQKVIFT